MGIVATLVFPPKVATSDAGRAIDGLADAVSELLVRAADELDAMAAGEPQRLPGAAREWLDDARRITHNIPQVGAALLKAEEGRRLNVRAVRTPHVEPGLRQGLEALEHSAVAIRGLMRSLADASDGDWLDEDSARATCSRDLSETFRELAAGTDAFGELVRHEGDAQASLSQGDIARLQDAQDGLLRARTRLDAALTDARLPDVIELLAATRVDRPAPAARARPRRAGTPPAAPASPTPLVPRPGRASTHRRRRASATGPDDETQVLPRLPDEPPQHRS